MKILNFGSCNMDYVYSLDHIVKAGETEQSHKMEIFPGGKGLNQSIAIAKAGAKVYHAGCIGSDGELMLEILNANGVDTTYMQAVDAKNGHAVIQVNAKGENSIFLYAGSNEMVTEKQIDKVLEDFEENDIVLLQNEISNVPYIIEHAHKKKMCIVLNPSPFNEEISKIDLSKISYLILNEIEAQEISGCVNGEESLAYFKENYPNLKVMLTLGDKGCVYMDSNHILYHPIFPVKVVDTTAAGDTFTGYFIAGIAQKMDYSDIIKISSCASSLAVSVKGAAPSIPFRDAVMNKLEKEE